MPTVESLARALYAQMARHLWRYRSPRARTKILGWSRLPGDHRAAWRRAARRCWLFQLRRKRP